MKNAQNVLLPLCLLVTYVFGITSVHAGDTKLSLKEGKWYINDEITYPGASAEGLLMNIRMVNATFEDPVKKPDFDPKANTAVFVEKIPEYMEYGVRGFTFCLQGGMPGYEGAVNSAFNEDGTLKPDYMARMKWVIDECDRLGCVVILGCYYQRQDQILQDEEAVLRGLSEVVKWIRVNEYEHIILEVANEFPHSGFDHDLIKTPEGMAKLIRHVKQEMPELLVSASGYGNGIIADPVAKVSDLLLPHYNGTPVEEIPQKIERLKKYDKPIVCNEDDKVGEKAAQAMETCVEHGTAYGYMGKLVNQYEPFEFKGAQDDPAFYAKLKELTSAKN